MPTVTTRLSRSSRPSAVSTDTANARAWWRAYVICRLAYHPSRRRARHPDPVL